MDELRERVERAKAELGLNQNQLADKLAGRPGFASGPTAAKWLSKLKNGHFRRVPLEAAQTVLQVLEELGYFDTLAQKRGEGQIRGGQTSLEGLMVLRGSEWIGFNWLDCSIYSKEDKLRMRQSDGREFYIKVVRDSKSKGWSIKLLGPVEKPL